MSSRRGQILGFALFVAVWASGCSSETAVGIFQPDNLLVVTYPWDNAITLQRGLNNPGEEFGVIIHAGRALDANDVAPAPADPLLLPGITRFQATLNYDPLVVQYLGFRPGNFFETSSTSPVNYQIGNETGPNGLPRGTLVIDISVPSSTGATRKANFVELEFRALDLLVLPATTSLQFFGGFGALERDGVTVTGSTYYGGRITVGESSQ